MANKIVDVTLRFVDGFTKPMQGAIGSLEKHARQYKRMGKEIESTGKSISKVGSSLTKAVTVPVVGLGAAAVKTAAEFEAGMSKVQSISGASGKDLDRLSEKAKEMGSKTKFSATESAEAFSYMAMAGWKTEDMLSGIEGVMYLAGASGEDLAMTSDIVTDALTAFGMKASDTNKFVDVLAKTASNANTDVAKMGETFQYVAPVAGALGYNVEDVSVAIGLMANSGIKASSAGTALRSLFTNLAKPTDAVDSAMTALGISLTDSEGNMKSLSVMMKEMRGAFAGLSESQKAQYAATLAGKTGMSGLLAIVNSSDSDFDALTESIANSTGAAKDMYNVANDNLTGRLTILKSTLESIAITFGEKLMPYVEKGVAKIQSLADKFGSLDDATVGTIIKIAGIAAAVGPALLVFGKMVTIVGKVVGVVGKVGMAIKSAGSVMALITSPAGIVIMVLGALVVAGVLVYKNWDKIKQAAAKVWGFVTGVFNNTGNTMSSFGEKFGQIRAKAGELIEGAKELWAIVSPYLMKLGEIFTTVFQVYIGAAVGAAVGYFSAFASGVMDVVSGIMTVLGGIIDFVKGVFTGNWKLAWEGIKEIFSGAFSALVSLAKMPINGVIGIINGAISGINKLGITIPDWVPVIGGKGFHINIPTIPMLYKGTKDWAGGPAMIHDRGAEIVDLPKGSRVYPHDKSLEMARASGSKSIQFSIAKLADSIIVREDADIDKIAEKLAKRLEETALNMGVA